MQRQTKIASLLSVGMLFGVLTGCSSPDSGQPAASGQGTAAPQKKPAEAEPIELRFAWWGSQDRHDRTLKVIDLFEKQNPNIKISPEFAGNEGYWEKIATQAAGKNLPDIMQMSLLYLADYTARGLVQNMDPYVKSGVLDLSDVDDVYTSSGKVNGNLYALNIGSNALGTAVDPAMYEKAGVPLPKPGQTWEEFMKEARDLKAKLGANVYVRGHFSFPGFQYYLRGHGLNLYNKDGTGLGFDKKYLVDYFTMMKTLQQDGILAPPQVDANVKGLEDELIVHGKAPNQNVWSNQIVALIKAAGRPLKLTMAPIVAGEGNNKSYYIRAGQFVSLSANSKHPEAAAKFVSFFTNSLEANEILAAERGIPVAAKVRAHLYPKLDPASKEMFDFLETAGKYAGKEVESTPAGDSSVLAAFLRSMEALSYGQSTPDAAASSFMAEANKVLEKNKK